MGRAKKKAAKTKVVAPESSGRFAYDGLERAIHEKARLGIMTSLVSNQEGLLFSDLKELCCLTDGNLSRHIKVLQDAGLVEDWKGFKQRRPQTRYRLTPKGRKRFLGYVSELERVIADAATATAAANAKTDTNSPINRKLRGLSPA